MNRVPALSFILLLGAAASVDGAELAARLAARNSVTTDELQAHAAALADDTFEGREAGSRGGRAAAGYIIEKLKHDRVLGGGDDGTFIQSFSRSHRNVLAVIRGNDPRLADEYVVIGAHYDHVGYGSASNSYGPIGRIHNGADDNASGVATVLETAQAIAQLDGSLRRSVLFAFWDGEEKGLLGSAYWLGHPTVPLANVRCGINLDMVGRLRDKRLELYGSRTAVGLRRFISERNGSEGLGIDFLWLMQQDSDHYSFFKHSIPALMFHTGKHGDYHRPSDDVEKLNVEGMQSISRLLVDLVIDMADAEALPAFRTHSIGEGRDERNRENFEKPLAEAPDRLGVICKQAAAGSGLSVVQVFRETAGWNALIENGDRIMAFNGEALTDPRRLQELTAAEKGPVTLTVLPRGRATTREAEVTLDGPPVRIGIAWIRDEAEPTAAIVKKIYPGSAAEQAGLKVADRIYSINGDSFATGDEFENLLHAAVGKVELAVERRGRVTPVVLNLGDK